MTQARSSSPAPAPSATPEGAQKYVSAATWERAKAEYLAGETAAVVCRRHGIGVDNFRKRQINEGWTRKAVRAARGDGPWPEETARARASSGASGKTKAQPGLGEALGRLRARARFELGHQIHPATALSLATGQAATLVAEGRGAEAQAVIKAAESLSRLTGMQALAPMGDAENLHAREAALLELYVRIENTVRARALGLVQVVLGWDEDDTSDEPPLERAYKHAMREVMWKAERAKANRKAHRREPWAEDVWDATGKLRDQAEIDRRTMERYRDDWRVAMALPTDAESWKRAERDAKVPDPSMPEWARARMRDKT